MKGRLLLVAAMCACTPIVAIAQSSTTIPSDYYRHIEQAENVEVLGNDLFGDQVDVSSGSISFRHTIVSLPGGNGLPVEATYVFKPYQRLGVYYAVELARPYISGIFSIDTGWVATSTVDNGPTTARCSSPIGNPPELDNTDGKAERFFPEEYWTGNQLVLEDGSSEFMGRLGQGASVPTSGGPYTWTTKNHWYFSCEKPPSLSGAEAFVGLAPNGTRYYFDEPASGTPTLAIRKTAELGGDTILQRKEVRFYVSKIEDRFGNWVTYSHDASGALVISSNDGRKLTISTSGNVSTVSDGVRSWTVTVDAASGVTTGLNVDNPDGTRWSLQKSGGISDNTTYLTNSCDNPPVSLVGQDSIVVSAPSGASATYTIKPIHFGKSFVTFQCSTPPGKSYSSIIYPAFYDNAAITQKVVTGPGLPTLTWSYDYGASNGCYAGTYAPADVACTANSPTYHQVVVTNPDSSVTRYTVSNKWNTDTEGLIIKEETGTSLASISRTITTDWAAFRATGSIGPKLGGSSSDFYLRVPSKKANAQDSNTYVWQVETFDNYSKPTTVKRSNNISGQSPFEEQTIYHNDTSLWVLSQPEQLINVANGEVINKTVYNTKDLPAEEWHFGQKIASYAYDTLGRLSTATDGNGHTTTYSNYKLGIPQQIDYPDQTFRTAAVNSIGQIQSISDQAGSKTCYSYDAVGRLALIQYPSETVAGQCGGSWNQTQISFSSGYPAADGLPAGHWRQRVITGNSMTETLYDGLWRPVIRQTYDRGNVNATISQTVTRYGKDGRVAFASYPQREFDTAITSTWGDPSQVPNATGTHTLYDALGRVKQVTRDSELGSLPTTTAYLSGARVQVTDPKGKVTTTSYQVFDQPSYDAVLQVTAPTGLTQTIARDLYGNPLSISQAGPYGTGTVSLTKTLTYDAYHRLCRTTEPESGNEVMAYDGANNLAWSAAGLSLTGSGCGQDQVVEAGKTMRGYDAMNRLLTLTPPAGTQSTAYGYDALGNLKSAVSGLSTWSAARNKRGLLTSETLQLTGQSAWAVGYGYDANGSLKSLTYPDGTAVAYTPNALGQATQVGAFANSIAYFPNGETASFNYGNGTTYLADQNTRQLLSTFSYGIGSALTLSEDFGYDKNGNITTVTDLSDGANGLRTKAFGYDDLNRLTSATATHLWGAESYSYDPLNNIRSRVGNGATFTYNYDPTNRLVSITGAGSSILGYDNRGNVTSKNGSTLEFDQKNQLTQIDGLSSYSYDAAGRRVMKAPAGGDPTYYFYSQAGQLLYQWEPATLKATDFIYLGRKLVARQEGYITHVIGNVDGVDIDGAGNATVRGWACTTGLAQSINVDLYLGGPAGSGTGIGRYTANQASEPAVASACEVSSGSYRFTIPLSAALRSQYPGQTIYVHGISPVGNGNPAIASSGKYLVPAAQVDGAPALTAPANNTTGSYTVSWTGITDATSYNLQEQLDGGAWSTVQTGANLSWTAADKGDGTYGYQVQACNSAGCGLWSAIATTVVSLPPASAPTVSVPSASNSGSYAVSWTGVATATSYTLQEQVNSGSWTTIQTGSATSRAISGKANGSYGYRAQACNSSGCGPWSATDAIVVTHPPASAPTVSVPTSSSTGSYTVSWTTVSTATSYSLQEQVNGGAWTTIQTGSTTSRAISGKGNGTYGYHAQACNVGGCSGWSATDSISVVRIPATPTGLTATVYTEFDPDLRRTLYELDASWTAVSGATSYDFQYCASGSTTCGVANTTSTAVWITTIHSSSFTTNVRACNASGCSAWSPAVTPAVVSQ